MTIEISLNVLDVSENFTRAGVSLVSISVIANMVHDKPTIAVADDGCGMTAGQVTRVTDPFFTTRTIREVEFGIPFSRYAAGSTGGSFHIEPEPGKGTTVTAVSGLSHIDGMPLDDMNATIHNLIVYRPDADFVYTYAYNDASFTPDIREIREILGGIPLSSPEVFAYIMELPRENQQGANGSAQFQAGRLFIARWMLKIKENNRMKVLAELQAIRGKMQSQVSLRAEDHSHTRMAIGMATCGIAVDAGPALNTLAQEVQPRGLADKISVTQAGCIGLYQYRPIMEVMESGKEEVTYAKTNPDKTLEVMECHLIGGHPVEKYTMGAADLKQ